MFHQPTSHSTNQIVSVSLSNPEQHKHAGPQWIFLPLCPLSLPSLHLELVLSPNRTIDPLFQDVHVLCAVLTFREL